MREVLKCQEALVVYAFAVVKDWHLAEDAVQEAFIAIAEQWDDFVPGAGVLARAKAIVHNKAVDLVRKRVRQDRSDTLDEFIQSCFHDELDEQAVHRQARKKEALETCLAQLHFQALSLLLGFYRDRKSCDDLAAMFRKSVNAVRLSISRTRAQLRSCVNRKLSAIQEPA